MKRRTFVAAAASTYASIAVLRRPADAAEFSYKLGLNITPTHPQSVRASEAAAKILQESGGALDIKVFPNSMLGDDTHMLGQLRVGALEFQMVADNILANLVPATGIDSLDFIFADFKQAWAASDGALGNYIRGAIAKAGMIPVGKTWDNGFKQIIVNRAVNSPDDLHGLKIRTPPSAVQVAVFKALGASPVPLNVNELYTGLQTHLVDGAELGFAAIEDGKYYEVTKFVANTHHYWTAVSLIGNSDTWNRLPKKLRDLTSAAFDEACLKERADVASADATFPARLQSTRGMTVDQVDFAAFQKAVRTAGLYSQWRETYGPEAWGLLEKSVGHSLA